MCGLNVPQPVPLATCVSLAQTTAYLPSLGEEGKLGVSPVGGRALGVPNVPPLLRNSSTGPETFLDQPFPDQYSHSILGNRLLHKSPGVDP